MVEGSEGSGVKDSVPVSVEKLLIDDLSNFQFHAAYLAYSDAFDRTVDVEGKKRLNECILALQKTEVDFAGFYQNIGRFRGESGYLRDYGRSMIKVQKKREWRRKTQKHERIERHKR
jgi:hypothetical protein